MTLLIVDDSALTRKALHRIIEMINLADSAVLEAENGREALRILNEQSVDLVLADLNMPDINGIEMIETMHAHPQLSIIPVVIISTETSETRIAELRANGATDYLHKPFTPRQVKAVLERVLEGMTL